MLRAGSSSPLSRSWKRNSLKRISSGTRHAKPSRNANTICNRLVVTLQGFGILRNS